MKIHIRTINVQRVAPAIEENEPFPLMLLHKNSLLSTNDIWINTGRYKNKWQLLPFLCTFHDRSIVVQLSLRNRLPFSSIYLFISDSNGFCEIPCAVGILKGILNGERRSWLQYSINKSMPSIMVAHLAHCWDQ